MSCVWLYIVYIYNSTQCSGDVSHGSYFKYDVCFTHWLLFSFAPEERVPITHPRRKSPNNPLKRKMGGTCNQSGYCGDGKNLLPLLRIGSQSSAVQPWYISKINQCVLQMYPNSYHHLTETDKLYYQDTVGHPTSKAEQTTWNVKFSWWWLVCECM